jgi:hypothetical protein
VTVVCADISVVYPGHPSLGEPWSRLVQTWLAPLANQLQDKCISRSRIFQFNKMKYCWRGSTFVLLLQWVVLGLVWSGGVDAQNDTTLVGAASVVADLLMNITLPESTTEGPDAYLCSSFDIPAGAHSIVQVVPLAKQEHVHHMLLYGTAVGSLLRLHVITYFLDTVMVLRHMMHVMPRGGCCCEHCQGRIASCSVGLKVCHMIALFIFRAPQKMHETIPCIVG